MATGGQICQLFCQLRCTVVYGQGSQPEGLRSGAWEVGAINHSVRAELCGRVTTVVSLWMMSSCRHVVIVMIAPHTS